MQKTNLLAMSIAAVFLVSPCFLSSRGTHGSSLQAATMQDGKGKKPPPPDKDKKPASKPASAPASDQVVDLANKVCPVMKVDKKKDEATKADVFVVHEGKKIHFCCKNCVVAFRKDPAKYLSALPPAKK